MPKIIELEQNTEEWKSYRKNRIGASEASIVLGISPYCTQFQLWKRKLGLLPEQEEHGGIIRGKALETQALWLYEESKGILMSPMVFESEEHPFLAASLDGVSVNLDTACEIKCLSLEQHDKQVIPEIYYPQLQQQMEILKLNEIDYVGYHPQSSKPFYIIKCLKDDKFIADYIPKAKFFWDSVQSFTAPPLCQKDYRDYTQNVEYAALDAAYFDLSEKIDGLTKQKDEIRNIMESMSEGNNVIGPYNKMTHYTSQGRIDYKKAVTENLPEINLEPYRGKPTHATRITKI